MPTETRLSSGQRWLLDNVRSTSGKRADRSLRRARLSAEKAVALDAAVQYLQGDDIRIVINADLRKIHSGLGASVIEGLLTTKRLLNRFEVELAQQNTASPNMMSRIMEEPLLYGGTPDVIPVLALLPGTDRPHYGALDFIGNPRTIPMLGFYGPYRFRLRKEVLQQSTFTAGSVPMIPSDEVYVWEDIKGVLVRKFHILGQTQFLFEYVNNREEPLDFMSTLGYIEVQVLGGIRLKEDVDRLYYPVADRYTQLFAQMEQLASECEIELMPY